MEHTFYKKVKANPEKITWKDIFSEYNKKHSKADFEYAMMAGTSLNQVTETDMLQKWRKPWMWYPMLKGGLVLIGLLCVIFFGTMALAGNVTNSLNNMFIMIPPIVIPFVFMIFFWELNIPRNISIYELLGCFLIGGFISFAATAFMFNFVPSDDPAMAAFREEPAKLIVSLIFLFVFSKKKKIYGLTGLVIGAAVGAGFGAFESISYAFNYGSTSIESLMNVQITRAVFAVGGHTIYCAPYTAAFALALKKNSIWNCFIDVDFLLMLASSTACHYVWNSNYFALLGVVKNILIIVLLWIELLYILRKCFTQMTYIGTFGSGQPQKQSMPQWKRAPANASQGRTISLTWTSGAQKGATFGGGASQSLYIGRGEENQIRVPAQVKGVSRRHCCIQHTTRGWTVTDLNSTYGTYLRGVKLTAGEAYPLQNGDHIYVGGETNVFQVRF